VHRTAKGEMHQLSPDRKEDDSECNERNKQQIFSKLYFTNDQQIIQMQPRNVLQSGKIQPNANIFGEEGNDWNS